MLLRDDRSHGERGTGLLLTFSAVARIYRRWRAGDLIAGSRRTDNLHTEEKSSSFILHFKLRYYQISVHLTKLR